MKHIIYLFLYLSFTTAQAQWNITLPNGESLNLQWQERENSQQNKGIHTFVGYSQNQFVATLVVHPNKEASGSLQWEGITYQLTGSQRAKLSAKELRRHNPNARCGTDTEQHTSHFPSPQNSPTARPITTTTSLMPNDPEGILYLYRLAVLVQSKITTRYHRKFY